jgi:tetratricopeptide (TPR) repeat protein
LGKRSGLPKDTELASRNGSLIPRLWLAVRVGWVQMEAFDFDQPLAMYEQYAAAPDYLSQRHNFPMLLWLGQARLGAGNVDGACEALERLHAGLAEGGVPFQVVCPLFNLRAECAFARKDMSQAKALAESLVQIASEHHETSYVAQGRRLLAEIDLHEGDYSSALAHLSHAEAALERCEAWTVEWRVHATAARVLTKLNRPGESAEARERSLRITNRVADTLVDEPALRESFLGRVNRELSVAQVTSV